MAGICVCSLFVFFILQCVENVSNGAVKGWCGRKRNCPAQSGRERNADLMRLRWITARQALRCVSKAFGWNISCRFFIVVLFPLSA